MASVKLNEMVQAKHDSTALGTGRTALSGSHVSACCEPDCLVTAFETTVYIGEATLAVVAVSHVRLTIIGPIARASSADFTVLGLGCIGVIQSPSVA